jgi:hypothetical protein
LIRRPGDLPEGGDERLKSMEQVVLKPENLPKQLQILANEINEEERTIRQNWNDALGKDKLVMKILKALEKGESVGEITI